MEEDIKILEGFRKYSKYYKEIDGRITMTIDLGLKTELDKAIENLIKGYREKEESEKYLYDAYQDAGKKMFEYAEQLEDSVPKSKIKDKIEELKKEFDFYAGREHVEWQDGEFDGDVCDDIALKIQLLKELMEDK